MACGVSKNAFLPWAAGRPPTAKRPIFRSLPGPRAPLFMSFCKKQAFFCTLRRPLFVLFAGPFFSARGSSRPIGLRTKIPVAGWVVNVVESCYFVISGSERYTVNYVVFEMSCALHSLPHLSLIVNTLDRACSFRLSRIQHGKRS